MEKKDLLRLGNVVAVGEGLKNGDGPPAVIVSVTKKLPLSQLADKDIVPATVEDKPTDVVEVGVIKAFGRQDRNRPALGGDSIGHVDITAGTLGVLLQQKGAPVILSNNHVLADSNAALVGDEIIQPGRYDGGRSPADVIGHLKDFEPIYFEGDPLPPPPEPPPSDCVLGVGAAKALNSLAAAFKRETRLMAVKPHETPTNIMDAAIASPTHPGDVSPEVRNIGVPTGWNTVGVGDFIHKSGRTTGYTQDTVLQTNVMVQVQYGAGKIAVFENQLMAGAMSQGGDSGSAIFNGNNELVGLLFAGSDTTTIFSPIGPVRNRFDLSL